MNIMFYYVLRSSCDMKQYSGVIKRCINTNSKIPYDIHSFRGRYHWCNLSGLDIEAYTYTFHSQTLCSTYQLPLTNLWCHNPHDIAGDGNTCLQPYCCYGWWQTKGTSQFWISIQETAPWVNGISTPIWNGNVIKQHIYISWRTWLQFQSIFLKLPVKLHSM